MSFYSPAKRIPIDGALTWFFQDTWAWDGSGTARNSDSVGWLGMDLILPFKVGDAVETRSYNVGYRGAWFRCKITDMCIRSGHMECQVEYIDYPDERRKWNRLYKVPPKCPNQKASPNREIMLRPPFPQWCWENDISKLGLQMDVVAVVSNPWKVGDLIDWWYTDCFWTGKIIELLDDDKVKIICPEIPLGEGGCWVADPNDLRPALDWSLEKGWSTPLSQENGKCWHTARLIAGDQDTGSSSSDDDVEQSCDGNEVLQRCLNGSSDSLEQEIGKCQELAYPGVKHPANTNGRCCMKSQIDGEEEPQKFMNEEPDASLGAIDSKVQLAPNETVECCTNSQADCPTSPVVNSGQSPQFFTNEQSSPPSCKKLKTSSEHASLKPTGTVSETTMKLQELVNKIRRAQNLLQSVDYAPSSIALAPWKFEENNPWPKRN